MKPLQWQHLTVDHLHKAVNISSDLTISIQLFHSKINLLYMSSYHIWYQDTSSNINNIVAIDRTWVKWGLAYSDWIFVCAKGSSQRHKNWKHGYCIPPLTSFRSFLFLLKPLSRDYYNWIESIPVCIHKIFEWDRRPKDI